VPRGHGSRGHRAVRNCLPGWWEATRRVAVPFLGRCPVSGPARTVSAVADFRHGLQPHIGPREAKQGHWRPRDLDPDRGRAPCPDLGRSYRARARRGKPRQHHHEVRGLLGGPSPAGLPRSLHPGRPETPCGSQLRNPRRRLAGREFDFGSPAAPARLVRRVLSHSATALPGAALLFRARRSWSRYPCGAAVGPEPRLFRVNVAFSTLSSDELTHRS
jgi:hypothetical protein